MGECDTDSYRRLGAQQSLPIWKGTFSEKCLLVCPQNHSHTPRWEPHFPVLVVQESSGPRSGISRTPLLISNTAIPPDSTF